MSTGGALAAAPARQRAEVLDLLAGVIAALLLALILAGLTGPVRLLLAVAFTFFVPGRAIVSNWSRMAGWSDIGMSIAFSLGILTLFATIALWVKLWHPLGIFEVEAVASLVGICVAVARRRAEQASAAPDPVPPRSAPRRPPVGQARPRPRPGYASGGSAPTRAAPRYPSGDRVPPRPGPRNPPAGEGPPRPARRNPPAGEGPPRPARRYPPGGEGPPRPRPRYPPGGEGPPRPRPRYPSPGESPRFPDPRYPPGGRVPPRSDERY
jgi:hypothetical protein